ncbi:MAG: glycosyltransferase involved in cell wall biosynthesis [Flavobacteriales bacterium]|jgi:glycosyltransferase involved in cell wall biosynthesis
MKVSVIIPCRNEEAHIESMLHSLLKQKLSNLELEILVADGMSDDQTAAIVKNIANTSPNIRLIENPDQVVPHGLNKAIKQSTGEIILRMDAHSEYPQNYIQRLVDVLLFEGADNVGGVWDTQPGADTNMARSIVVASSSKFGVGNAQYRLEGEGVIEVDTVPYGCYLRTVFDRIGLFDEDMVRNQDDELNARLTKAGGKILLITDLKIKYYARPTLRKLIKMFYQYGVFKPLVAKKVGQPATWRQFFPAAFVLGNICGLVLGFLNSNFWGIVLIVNLLHLFVGKMIGLNKYSEMKSVSMIWQVPVIIYCMHWSYGFGYLKGVWRFILLGKKPSKIAPSR